MISKSRAQIALIVIFTIMVFSTMRIAEAAYESQTIRIDDTAHDGFVTESGIMWSESTLIHVLDPNMEIRAFLMFENIEINSYEVLNNATLRLRTASSLPVDAGSNIWIYGVCQNDFLGFFDPSDVTSALRTYAFVNLDTSAFSGSSWTEIDVTEIISELIGNIGWDGDDIGGISDNIGFVMFGSDEGYDTRYFYDESAGNGLEAQLVINWGDAPPPPAPAPGDPSLPPGDPDPEVNETYRELIIWEVDHRGPNRTGSEADVNWNLLNMTELTEIDSGAAMTLNNDTWVSISAFVGQQHNAFYNDTGSANINSFFVRFKINTTSVTNNGGGGVDRVMAVCSVTTVTPVGGNGLLDDAGHAGNWVGLVMQLNADDVRYNFRWIDRSGAAFNFGTGSPYYSEAVGQMVYIEVSIFDDGAADHWYRWSLYLDEDFETLIFQDTDSIVQGRGPWRYPQVISAVGFGTSRVNTAEFYTYNYMPVAENSTWLITFQNGTIIVQGLDDYDDAIDYIEDMLGADPQDPTPPGEGWDPEGPFSRFRTRLYILMIGFLMIFGPLMVWAMKRPSGYEFVIGVFIMFIGFALMYAAGQV